MTQEQPQDAQSPVPGPRPVAPIIAAVCAALVIAGSIGPWVTWGPFSVSGTDGDGVISLVLGLVAGLIAIVGIAQPGARSGLFWLMTLAFLGATGIGIYHWANLESMAEARAVGVSAGWGLVILTFGAATGTLTGFFAALQGSSSATKPAAASTSSAETPAQEHRDPFRRD